MDLIGRVCVEDHRIINVCKLGSRGFKDDSLKVIFITSLWKFLIPGLGLVWTLGT